MTLTGRLFDEPDVAAVKVMHLDQLLAAREGALAPAAAA
jgi:hypothetical protein